MIHTLDVTWGPSGSMTYNAADVRYPNVPLISYSAKHDMGSSASIKVIFRLLGTCIRQILIPICSSACTDWSSPPPPTCSGS